MATGFNKCIYVGSSLFSSVFNRTKKTYSDVEVNKAFIDIKENILSVVDASKKYKIPRTTSTNQNSSDKVTTIRKKPKK